MKTLFAFTLIIHCALAQSNIQKIVVPQDKSGKSNFKSIAAKLTASSSDDHYDGLRPPRQLVPRWKQGTENATRSADDGNKAPENEAKIEDQPSPEPRQTETDIPSASESDCCWKVKVAFTTNHLNGAYKLHKYIFGFYTMEPGLVNGKPHYTSVHGDGAFALAFCGDSWWLQSTQVRGECKGWAHSGWRTDNCPSNIDYTWRYFIPTIDEFVEANKGLSIWCKS